MIKIDGVTKNEGDFFCDELNVDGIFKVKGNLEASQIKGDGIIEVDNNLIATDINGDGVLNVKGKIEVEKLNFDGLIKATNIKGENLNIDGSIKISENVNCDNLHFDIKSKSFITCIEGSKVVTKSKGKQSSFLKVNSITADDIDIEYVICEAISGDKVKIGKGCKINHITYITHLEVHNDAEVKTSERIITR